jgi:hypothetical protein
VLADKHLQLTLGESNAALDTLWSKYDINMEDDEVQC